MTGSSQVQDAVAWLEARFEATFATGLLPGGTGPMIGLHPPDSIMTEASSSWPRPHEWHDLNREACRG